MIKKDYGTTVLIGRESVEGLYEADLTVARSEAAVFFVPNPKEL